MIKIVKDLVTLSKISRPISKEEAERLCIFENLEITLKKYKGAGLSAIQIGIPVRAFIIQGDKLTYCFRNPSILDYGPYMEFKNEGCLSFPGKIINTWRAGSVEVDSDNGSKKTLNGYMAWVFQHELDHLDGLTMFDRKKGV